jgi:DNA polymerase III delta subunit
VGLKNSVTPEHIRLVMTPTTNYESWDLADAVFSRNQKSAMNIVARLYQFAPEDPTLMIHGALVKSAERLFVAKSMKDKRASDEEIASRLGMHPYRYKTSFSIQVDKQNLKGLVKTMRLLSNLDVELKRTTHRRTMLELAIFDLAT